MNMLLTLTASLTLLVWGNALWANDNTISEPQTTACDTCHGAKERARNNLNSSPIVYCGTAT